MQKWVKLRVCKKEEKRNIKYKTTFFFKSKEYKKNQKKNQKKKKSVAFRYNISTNPKKKKKGILKLRQIIQW